jgi:putative transposase
VLFIDAIVVKVRDGQVTNRPFYVVIGVTVNGERDILGIWAGDGSEGAKFVEDVCIVVCDGLKGLADSITSTSSLAQVQTCILHLIRNTFRYASRRDWEAIARDLKPVYTAANEQAAKAGSTSSPGPGATSTRPSSAHGSRHRRSSSRSWTTTWRSVG